MSDGKIVFGGIATASGLKAYHSNFVDINPIVQALLSSIDFNVDQKRSFGAHARTKGHTIQYVVENEYAYICSATAEFPHRVSFKFLQSVLAEHKSSRADVNGAKGQATMENYIREKITFFSNDPDADQLRALNKQVDEVKNIMHSNIEAVLSRGDSLEGIMNKAEDLEDKSVFFKKKTKEVKCAMIRENIKMTVLLIAVVLVILLILGGLLGGLIAMIVVLAN